MINPIDSLWDYFKTRMSTINSSRQCVGVMDAQDWPPKQILFNSFYLITLGDSPLGKSTDSATIPVYVQTVQFTWIAQGTDIGTETDLLGRNRGDRYRTNFTMKQELLQALYPGYTQQEQLSVSGQTVNREPINSPLIWSKPSFVSRSDQASGIIYQTVTVVLTSMLEAITA